MLLKTRVMYCFIVGALALSPLWALPALSAHAPTYTAESAPTSHGPALPALPALPLAFGMAIRIKDVQSIANKFVQRAQGASNDYASGVQGAGQDWQTNALAAEGNYEAGVQQALADKRYGKGVSDAGAAKYVDNATKLGPQRFQTGVAQAQGAYAKGAGKHLDMMRNLNLPPRGPKGSPQNQQRAQAVAAANRALKLGKSA